MQLTKNGQTIHEFPAEPWDYARAKAVPVFLLAGPTELDPSTGERVAPCPLCRSGLFRLDTCRNRWTCSACGQEREKQTGRKNRWHSSIGFVMRRDGIEAKAAIRELVKIAECTAQSGA